MINGNDQWEITDSQMTKNFEAYQLLMFDITIAII